MPVVAVTFCCSDLTVALERCLVAGADVSPMSSSAETISATAESLPDEVLRSMPEIRPATAYAEAVSTDVDVEAGRK